METGGGGASGGSYKWNRKGIICLLYTSRRIWNSPAKIRNVATKAHRMVMRLNNIYAVGNYFFIDFSIENKTNIRFDIDEIRIKLTDKKLAKATNAQPTIPYVQWHRINTDVYG